jgi:signal transduction histidine kinase
LLAADAERRKLEHAFHDGVQQHLVALAVKLQLVNAESAEANALLDELRSDVQQALDEAAQLAQRIYPSMLDAGGLAVALRAVVATAGAPVSVDVDAGGRYPSEVLCTVYFLCLEALEQGLKRISVREDDGILAFDIVAGGGAKLDRLRDRVEALGGNFAVSSEGRGVRVSGGLPIAR